MKKFNIIGLSLSLFFLLFFFAACDDLISIPLETKYLNLELEGEGQASITSGDYEEGSTVTFTLSPAEGWFFSEWKGLDSADLSFNDGHWLLLMDSDKHIIAVFAEEIVYHTIELSIFGEGEVFLEPEQREYELASTVLLTAQPARGWNFKGWTGELTSKEASIELLVDGDKELVAVFEEERYYTLELAVQGPGIAKKDPHMELYPEGFQLYLYGEPQAGARFVEWQGDAHGGSNLFTMTMDSDKAVTAVFDYGRVNIRHELNIDIIGEGTVLRNPDTLDYAQGVWVFLRAIPSAGWVFERWIHKYPSSTSELTVIMVSDLDVTAIFKKRNP